MLKIIFENLKTPVEADFRTISENVVELIGDIPSTGKGFKVYRTKDDKFLGDYSGFTTTYRSLENGRQYSNDGSVYVEPEEPEPVEPIEPSEPVELTPAEEIQARTLEERIEMVEDCLMELSEAIYAE